MGKEISLSTRIANQADKYFKKTYCLGDRSKGFDCLNLFMDFYRAFGYEFPKMFDGITEENYAEVWTNDNDRAITAYESFFLSLGDPVGVHYFIRGDLLLFKGAQLRLLAAISLGNGLMMMIGTEGVVRVPFQPYRDYLFAARRLIK